MNIIDSASGLPAVIRDAMPVSITAAAYRSKATITRPANVTTYSAGDVVGSVLTFAASGKAGENVMLTNADLQAHIAAIPSGMANFRLYLYNDTPVSAYADNAVWDLPASDRAAFLGYIELGAPVDLGSTLYTQSDVVNKQLALDVGDTALYGYLVTLGAYTPAANSEVYVPSIYTVAL